MSRKQNGFGGKSFGFKSSSGKIDVGKIKTSEGVYPSNRRYGSVVIRTIIEEQNKNSNWAKWRKGYEYYNQAAWYRLEEYEDVTQEYIEAVINSVLFQGTPEEVAVKFDGYKFATKNSDTNNHYVIKRSLDEEADYNIGTVREIIPNVKNDTVEIKLNAGPNVEAVFNMIGDRITDGITSATIDWVLTAEGRPALFIGKTKPNELAKAKVRIPYAEMQASKWFQDRDSNIQELVNEIVYIPDFYQRRPVTDLAEGSVQDYSTFFEVQTTLVEENQRIIIFDYDDEDLLPPTLYDIAELPENSLVLETTGSSSIEGSFIFDKSLYQPFYGLQYLTGDLVVSEVETFSYVILPFKIQAVELERDELVIESVPFMAELKGYSNLTDGSIRFAPNSFTKITPSPNKSGWQDLDTDVNPFIDEVFTTGNNLVPDTIYACSCPSYSKAMLRTPQQFQDDGTRKNNRQKRYPLPTAMSPNDYEKLGINQAAGIVESWATRKDLREFRMCKHSIAAMFIEHIKVKEPNDYPTLESRESFEEKLRKDIEEVADEFAQSYKRGGITALEVIFAMAQALGMDEVETAYVVLNANF